MNKNILASSRLFVFCASAVVLASCARTPVPELQPGDIPLDWISETEVDAAVWPNVDWWNNFGSEELTRFIEAVMEENISLQNNQRNLRLAQITLENQNRQLWPSPSLSASTDASASRQTFGEGGTSSGGSSRGVSVSGGVSYGNLLSRPLSFEGAVNSYESTLAQTYQTRLQTLVTAARSYFQLLYLRDQMEQQQVQLENALTIGGFTELQVEAGIAIPLDLLQQQNTIENLRNNLLSLEQQEFQRLSALALLLGRRVEDFSIEGETLEGIVVPAVQPGLPSELLRRRPDLVQAEISLRDAAIGVDQARLQFFPSISLSANGNASSPALLGVLADPATTSLSIGANLGQQIFQNGNRGRNLESSRIRLETSLANYRQSVLTAFNDVEIALNTIDLTARQGEVIRRQLEAAQESYRIAVLRYEQGVTNLQQFQTSQLDLIGAENAVLNNNLSQINNILDFYQVLGGGWEYTQAEALAEPPFANAN